VQRTRCISCGLRTKIRDLDTESGTCKRCQLHNVLVGRASTNHQVTHKAPKILDSRFDRNIPGIYVLLFIVALGVCGFYYHVHSTSISIVQEKSSLSTDNSGPTVGFNGPRPDISPTQNQSAADYARQVPTGEFLNAFSKDANLDLAQGDPTSSYGFPSINPMVDYYSDLKTKVILIVYPDSASLEADDASGKFATDVKNYSSTRGPLDYMACSNLYAVYIPSENQDVEKVFNNWCNYSQATTPNPQVNSTPHGASGSYPECLNATIRTHVGDNRPARWLRPDGKPGFCILPNSNGSLFYSFGN